MSDDWFSTGDKADEVVDQELERQKAAKEEREKNRFYRFWMKEGTDQYITFVDDKKSPYGYKVPFVFKEHNLKLNGHWRNWYTCWDNEDCPWCKSGDRPSVVAAYSVIDHREWTDKEEKVHKDEMKLFVCKSAVQKVLKKASRKKDGLRGWYTEVSRIKAESPNTGDQFDFEERRELPDDVQPPDYRKIFAPKTLEEAKKILGEVDVKADDDQIRF